ncbi:MAG TPA: thiolase domain-containing protein [Candidatus Syntrophoarchaeum butanivorans]|uniref:Acetyl-CoA acetyltransferase n=3 Tax=Candidatus Syntropharchaeum butanivorans TaxID=1839936 RepID=A0A1F2P8U6_9EURY|nr:MAG: acetyl-CoA acetyltransferase [Candidatus Syntrophoarchaeum butanivorans]HEC57517.1 thiolase domain-containing protein [Candidatus Syntrophoarchaeum butanivorans]
MRDVAIIGVGCTRFGELWDHSFRDLFVEAGLLAVEDAGIRGEDIDAIYLGNMSAGRFIEQEHVGALVVDHAGLASELHIPSTRVEAGCASGALALRCGIMAVASGWHDIVVAAGVEKMTDVSAGLAEDALASCTDREWEGFYGATLAGLFAMMARAHMKRYGTTREEMAMVSVKNHDNASYNPIAQFQNKISLDAVLNAGKVAEPLRLLDCSSIADGAAACVLAPLDIARRYTDTPVKVLASTQASDTIALHDRRDITTMDATVHAARKAFEIAGITPGDIDLAEVHDSYTISEIMAIEDLGFFRKGEGGKALERGATRLDGEIPINTSGGLKGCGNPLGATGVRQAIEIVWQLRGEAGKRQVDGAEIGLTHNVGGTGGTAIVHIFSI